jgi:hypothetical protein
VNLFSNPNIKIKIASGLYKAKEYYENNYEYANELNFFKRIFSDDFMNLPQEKIKSGGYIVDTLEAALWCLLNTDSYERCVLKAVNLGGDTDTVAAVAGGLAGIHYGINSIPEKWINQIVKLDYIKELCEDFYLSLVKSSVRRLCSYISYFENIVPDKACQFHASPSSPMGYWIYEDRLMQFIDDFIKSGLVDYNYPQTIEQRIPNAYQDMWKFIETADFELIKAILTRCIRAERFCDGAWADCVYNGVFLAILRRLEILLLSDTLR